MRWEGVSLRLAGWKAGPGHRWPGRQVIALVDGGQAGSVQFHAHPQGAAVEVSMLEVLDAFRGRGLASLLIDTVYEAYPDAWINHGVRSIDGAHWWDRYRDPAPERNVHNRPPGEWAAYFMASRVAADKTRNASWNRHFGLDGHGAAEYRYRQRLEMEFIGHDKSFLRRVDMPMINPTAQALHAGHLVNLPPGLHRYVHDTRHPSEQRAHALLDHVGHGNLPRPEDHTGWWNTSPGAALDDALHRELATGGQGPGVPATQLVFHARPLPEDEAPEYESAGSYLEYIDGGDVPVELAGLSWRRSSAPQLLHSAVFDPPVKAAVPPLYPEAASDSYVERYDEAGALRAPLTPWEQLIADRAGELRAVADRLLDGVAARAAAAPPSPPGRGPAPGDDPRQPPPTPAPRPRLP
ncbi:GNAT family N-acetyltransferase [Streptomyces sp. NPDC048272]|uniref:GNAT family N-acetyltransferase n=1 Tax=Streptomyces sp. NPDC048272 TaxID=3154616 RepID=UPI0034364897